MHPLQSALAFSGLVNAVVPFTFGLIVFIHGWREKDNRLFILFLLSVVVWSLAYWRWLSIPASGSADAALFWTRMLSIGSSFIPLFMFHWVVTFLDVRSNILRMVIKFSYILAFCFLAFSFSPVFVNRVEPEMIFPFWPKAGWLYTIYLVYLYMGLGAYALFLLIKKYFSLSKKDDQKRKLFLLVALGLGASFASGFTNFPLWYGIKVLPVGNFFVSTLAFIYGYAIIKHHLFNIKTIAAEFATMLVWVFLFLRIMLATTLRDRVIDSSFFAFTVFTGIFLIRSVRNEVRQKEQLADLNENLEAKVAEQTKEIRRAYEVEKKARHELEELDKAKTDFILTTQHHLRTPLTIVRSVGKMLAGKQEGEPYSKMDKTYVEKLNTGTDKLVSLINEFLDISQMEVGKSILRKTLTNIHSLIEESLGEISHEIETKQLRIETTFSESAKNAVANIDSKRLQSAFTNLLDNAVKYTPEEGRITITADITTHPIEKMKQYQLTIKDSGIGMTPEEQEKAFTRSFERGVRAKELNATGRGIGLMLTKNIIEAHGGTIELSSEGRDKGTTFAIYLPLGKEE